MAKSYDAIIVGAGVIGLSTAYLLSRNKLNVLTVAPRTGRGDATRHMQQVQ